MTRPRVTSSEKDQVAAWVRSRVGPHCPSLWVTAREIADDLGWPPHPGSGKVAALFARAYRDRMSSVALVSAPGYLIADKRRLDGGAWAVHKWHIRFVGSGGGSGVAVREE